MRALEVVLAMQRRGTLAPRDARIADQTKNRLTIELLDTTRSAPAFAPAHNRHHRIFGAVQEAICCLQNSAWTHCPSIRTKSEPIGVFPLIPVHAKANIFQKISVAAPE